MEKLTNNLLIAAIVLVGISGSRCFADLWGGSISWSDTDSDIVATASWMNTGTSLSWSVAANPSGDFYTYTYTFTAPHKALSHFILEVSGSFDLIGLDEDGLVNASLSPDELVAVLDTYESSGDKKPNPGMPGSIYGLKFENEEDGEESDKYFGEGTTWTWSFNSLREPVWGDFYAVDGKDQSEHVYAYNSGFLNADVEAGHIAVPDTTVIPVPGAVFLGMLGLGAAGVKLRKFA